MRVREHGRMTGVVKNRFDVRVAVSAGLLMVCGLLFSQGSGSYKAVEESLDQKPVEQPLPYSHKTHLALGMKCRDCHTIADPGFLAGYPDEAKCMACHTAIKTDSPHIKRLAEFSAAGKRVPWVKIYRVPDYVWFSHASHADDAAIECESCHGPVATREVLFKEKPTSMIACMDCHAKNGAPNDCDLCHDPG